MLTQSLVIQLAGHAGSGKTTLAQALAARMAGTLLDLDTVKSALLDAGLPWAAASRASYAVIYAQVDDLLARPGAVVLVDTPSYWPEIHERLADAAARAGAQHVFLECEADAATRAARIAARPARRSQLRALGEPPQDAPASMPPVHLRPIARPDGCRCIRLDTRGTTDLDALVRTLRDSSTHTRVRDRT